MNLNEVDLHVHLIQSLEVEDIFELAKDCYNEINWNRFGFLERYEKIIGVKLDPVKVFDNVIKTGSLQELKEIMIYDYNKHGNFDEFNIKSMFPICVTGYYYDNYDYYKVLEKIVARHKKQGIKYIEYRNGFMYSYKEEWIEWHSNFARFLKESSNEDFTAKYIVRTNDANLYPIIKEMLKENPDLKDTIVGMDLTEVNPNDIKGLFNQVRIDKENNNDYVDVIMHIGENFFDKSIESIIRWCHQAAIYGAKRLAHCIALGMKPEVMVARKEKAHETETVKDRIEQIEYDLEHSYKLEEYGVNIDEKQLNEELNTLKDKDLDSTVTKEYSEDRLKECKLRQDYVLAELSKIGTVIETCPTSNLCIGGVPSISEHPFKKLYDSTVNLAICSDDPGIFDQSVEDEIKFITNNFNISKLNLSNKLEDPYKYRLKK